MKRKFLLIPLALALMIGSLYFVKIGSKTVSKDEIEQLENFLKNDFVSMLEEDYRSHGIIINVVVTSMQINSIQRKETAQDDVYFAKGRVSYIIQGNKRWIDKEGNSIHLDTGQEITHWFSCGVLRDRYLGKLYKDDRNRFTFYADNPMKQLPVPE